MSAAVIAPDDLVDAGRSSSLCFLPKAPAINIGKKVAASPEGSIPMHYLQRRKYLWPGMQASRDPLYAALDSDTALRVRCGSVIASGLWLHTTAKYFKQHEVKYQ